MDARPPIALHAAQPPSGPFAVSANAFDLTGSGLAAAPDWIELVPAGPDILGLDGRRFRVSDPAALAARSAALAATWREPVVDYDHASDLAAPEGRPAPAAGWIKAFEVRDGGSVWGRVEWTAAAAADIAARRYRYISPVFTHAEPSAAAGSAAPEVGVILRAALTNSPNLTLTALNAPIHVPGRAPGRSTAALAATTQRTQSMNLAALLALLGLSPVATEDQARTAINALRTPTSATPPTPNPAPDPAQWVPKAQHDAVVTSLNAMKAAQATAEAAAFETKVEAALNGAIAAGKVVPAARDHYKALCASADGLATFEKLVADLPVIASAEAQVAAKAGGSSGATSLNAEEQAACAALGVSHDDFLKAKQKDAA